MLMCIFNVLIIFFLDRCIFSLLVVTVSQLRLQATWSRTVSDFGKVLGDSTHPNHSGPSDQVMSFAGQETSSR
jgi:hypothetical protein